MTVGQVQQQHDTKENKFTPNTSNGANFYITSLMQDKIRLKTCDKTG